MLHVYVCVHIYTYIYIYIYMISLHVQHPVELAWTGARHSRIWYI